MPYDPSKPEEGSPLESAVMRGQLNGLKSLIDANVTVSAAHIDAVHTLGPGSPANVTVNLSSGTLHFVFDIPQGPEGPTGPQGEAGAQGPPFADATVEDVQTLDPAQPATVGLSFDGTTVHFTFGIPRGAEGPQGPQGEPGSQGPPFATALVDGVATLDPGEPATVGVSFDGSNVHFSFGIPSGVPGPAGADGEVTNAAMSAAIDAAIGTAIAGTSNNTNAVATLDTPFADPDAEALRQKFNELVGTMRR